MPQDCHETQVVAQSVLNYCYYIISYAYMTLQITMLLNHQQVQWHPEALGSSMEGPYVAALYYYRPLQLQYHLLP